MFAIFFWLYWQQNEKHSSHMQKYAMHFCSFFLWFCVYPNYGYENVAATEKHVKFPFKYVFEICILSDCRSFAFDFRLLDFGFESATPCLESQSSSSCSCRFIVSNYAPLVSGLSTGPGPGLRFGIPFQSPAKLSRQKTRIGVWIGATTHSRSSCSIRQLSSFAIQISHPQFRGETSRANL